MPSGKEKEFADILDKNLDFVAYDSFLSGETHSWKVEGEKAPAFLPPTLGVPPRAAGASAARGGALPALPVGPSIGGGQAAAASIAWPPLPPVPTVYANALCMYGHRAAAYPGGRPVAPFSAVGACQSRICGGPAAAAAGPPQVLVSAAAAAEASCRPPAANPAPLPFSATSCGVGEAASVAAPGPGGPPPGARTSLETLITLAAAAPATPERDERGRPRPSPASGERPPGSKMVRHGQDMEGSPRPWTMWTRRPRPLRGPCTPPAQRQLRSPPSQSPRLAASRPWDDGTPPQAPPRKRPARDSAAAAQGQQAAPALQLSYAAHSSGYCISFSITWRNAEGTEHDRLATSHAIRHAITTWGARQPLGCMAVGKSRTDGLDFDIYCIHGDTVTLEVLDGVVEKVKDTTLSYPRRSSNMRVRLCKFNAKVERKLSLREAEVIDQIGGSVSPTNASAGARSYLGSKRPLLLQLPLRACVNRSWQPA